MPAFLRQMVADQEAQRLLNQLYRSSFSKDILLACFCPNESLCHRSILASLLLGAGAQIDCKQEYARYYKMYANIASGRA